jgi:hypothetical protein
MNVTSEIGVCEEAVRKNRPLNRERKQPNYFGDMAAAIGPITTPTHKTDEHWTRLADGFLKGIR